jgi:hypothetical protein
MHAGSGGPLAAGQAEASVTKASMTTSVLAYPGREPAASPEMLLGRFSARSARRGRRISGPVGAGGRRSTSPSPGRPDPSAAEVWSAAGDDADLVAGDLGARRVPSATGTMAASSGPPPSLPTPSRPITDPQRASDRSTAVVQDRRAGAAAGHGVRSGARPIDRDRGIGQARCRKRLQLASTDAHRRRLAPNGASRTDRWAASPRDP